MKAYICLAVLMCIGFVLAAEIEKADKAGVEQFSTGIPCYFDPGDCPPGTFCQPQPSGQLECSYSMKRSANVGADKAGVEQISTGMPCIGDFECLPGMYCYPQPTGLFECVILKK